MELKKIYEEGVERAKDFGALLLLGPALLVACTLQAVIDGELEAEEIC